MYPLKIADRRSELLAISGVILCSFQAGSRCTQGTGTDIQTATIQPHHGDLEALPFFTYQIFHRHAAIIKQHLGSRLRIPAHFAFLRSKADTRRIFRDSNTTHTASAVIPGPDHGYIDIRLATAGNKSLAAVDDILIPVPDRFGFKGSCIRSSPRLRQAITCKMLHGRQFGQELCPYRVGAEPVNHPARHIVDGDIGRR